MPNTRTRAATLATGLAISVSLLTTPVALGQDGPTAPLEGVLTAVEDGRLTDAIGHFCSELQAEALGGLGQLSMLEGLDFGLGIGLALDPDLLAGAVQIDVADVALNVTDETAETATVAIQANVETAIDEEGLVALITSFMSTEEAPMDESFAMALLPGVLPLIEEMIVGSFAIDETVDVVVEDGVWKVCSDLDSLADAFTGFVGGEPAATDGESSDG